MKFLGNRKINMNKIIGCLVLSVLTSMSAFAQSGTNSPYSQYGPVIWLTKASGSTKAWVASGMASEKGMRLIH